MIRCLKCGINLLNLKMIAQIGEEKIQCMNCNQKYVLTADI